MIATTSRLPRIKKIPPGKHKLADFKKAICRLDIPNIGSQITSRREDMLAYLRIVDVYGGCSWYILEWDRLDKVWTFFVGDETEFRHASLEDLSEDHGAMGDGLQIDQSYKPCLVKNLTQYRIRSG